MAVVSAVAVTVTKELSSKMHESASACRVGLEGIVNRACDRRVRPPLCVSSCLEECVVDVAGRRGEALVGRGTGIAEPDILTDCSRNRSFTLDLCIQFSNAAS